jgi:hypothetical protein
MKLYLYFSYLLTIFWLKYVQFPVSEMLVDGEVLGCVCTMVPVHVPICIIIIVFFTE